MCAHSLRHQIRRFHPQRFGQSFDRIEPDILTSFNPPDDGAFHERPDLLAKLFLRPVVFKAQDSDTITEPLLECATTHNDGDSRVPSMLGLQRMRYAGFSTLPVPAVSHFLHLISVAKYSAQFIIAAVTSPVPNELSPNISEPNRAPQELVAPGRVRYADFGLSRDWSIAFIFAHHEYLHRFIPFAP